MRVALIGPVFPYRGGIAHYTTSLAKTFENRGDPLLLISFKRQYPAWLYPGDTDKDPSQQSFEATQPRYWIDSLNPLTWLQTVWRIRDFVPHVIILQWWTTFFAPVWFTLALLNKIYLARPLVFICHNVLPHEERIWDRWIVRLVLGLASKIIVQSDSEQARLLALMPAASVSIVPHPVYQLFGAEPLNSTNARKSLAIDEERFVLLFFGMVRAYKGLRELLFALSRLQTDYPQLMLLIAGEFWEDKDEYLALIDELNLADSVRIDEGYVPNEEVARYYAAADLLAAPYRRHTGSGVIQVAAALDLPVVTLNALTKSCDGLAKVRSPQKNFTARVDYLEKAIRDHIEQDKSDLANQKDVPASSSWETLAETIANATKRPGHD